MASKSITIFSWYSVPLKKTGGNRNPMSNYVKTISQDFEVLSKENQMTFPKFSVVERQIR